MRCLIHEFGGYSFPLQLSRKLADRGNEVIHVYPVGLPGPKGRVQKSPDDSERLIIIAVPLSGEFRKYSPARRIITQRQYARDLKHVILRFRPDVVLSADTPIDVQAELLWFCRQKRIGFVHWVQDVYGPAIEFFLQRKIGSFAKPLSWPFLQLDKLVAKRSDRIIVISQEFSELHQRWGVSEKRLSVMENWAPLDEIPVLPRVNEWGRTHGLLEKTVFLYSGTLGHKHRPDLIYKLAESLDKTAKLVVVSQGLGRDYLAQLPKLQTLLLLDFQPYDKLPQVLATADVLVATLEADAGRFAVPSKILSYHCAGRPILFAAPANNLAAKVIARSGAGYSLDPGRPSTWIAAGKQLASDMELRHSLGKKARQYAEQTFDIGKIAAGFERTLIDAMFPFRAHGGPYRESERHTGETK